MDTEQMKGEIRFANADKDSNYTKGSNQTKSDLETAKLGPVVQLDDPNMAKGGEKELQVGKIHDKDSAELTNRLKRTDQEQSRRAYETFDTKPVREIQDELQGKGQKQESS